MACPAHLGSYSKPGRTTRGCIPCASGVRAIVPWALRHVPCVARSAVTHGRIRAHSAAAPAGEPGTPTAAAPASTYARAHQALLHQPARTAHHVVVYDMSDRLVDYEEAWAWQRQLLEHVIAASEEAAAAAAAAADSDADAQRSASGVSASTSTAAGVALGAASNSNGLYGTYGGAVLGAILLVQHPPVFTLGAGSTTDNLRFPAGAPPVPLYRTERGGEVTYHGPGQLVMYPIVDLRRLNPDLHWYLRRLEQVIIDALDAVSGLEAGREEGLTGVWVGGAKVAAIGVRAKKWVTYHGLALNVVPDLRPFDLIVPCGIADRQVTSVRALLAERQAEEDPFLAPSAALPEGPMMPLEQASQEDLRAMLLQAGGALPPVVQDDSRPSPRPDPDDPFAAWEQHEGPLELPAETARGNREDTAGRCFGTATASASAAAGPGGRIAGAAQESRSASSPIPAAAVAAGSGGGGSNGISTSNGSSVSGGWSAAELAAAAARRGPDEVQLLKEYSVALLECFADVFGVELTQGGPRGPGGAVRMMYDTHWVARGSLRGSPL